MPGLALIGFLLPQPGSNIRTGCELPVAKRAPSMHPLTVDFTMAENELGHLGGATQSVSNVIVILHPPRDRVRFDGPRSTATPIKNDSPMTKVRRASSSRYEMI
jgi:hypothetical protein